MGLGLVQSIHHSTFTFSYSVHKAYLMGPNRQNTRSWEVKVSQHAGFGEEQSFSGGLDFDWKTQIYSCCSCLLCVIRYVTVCLFSLIEDTACCWYLLCTRVSTRTVLSTQSIQSGYPPFIMSIYVLFSTCW